MSSYLRDTTLGDGTTTNRNTPVQVSSISNVAAIARGWVHSLALKSDGTAWAWGANSSGQLGDGTTINKTSPVKISNLNNVVDIAGGGGYTIALESDDTVWTCGEYGWDYYENNGGAYWYYLSSTTPDQVTGINDAVTVAGGWQHIVVLKQDGTVWTWGVNWYGQLGDGTTVDRDIPVQVDINLGKIPDIIIPTGSISINSGSVYTNSITVTLNLSASDGTGVTGYYLSTNSTTPLTSDSGWTSVTSTTSYSTSVSYILSSGDGIKTVYVWYKDAAGNISNAASDSITLDTATKTPTPTATPTPVSCDVATAITSSSSTVTVAKGNSTTVTITVTGAGGCRVESDTVSASSSDRNIATVSPSKATTNASGQATFTITGSQKGSAKVTFKETTANLKTKTTIKVTK